MLVVSILPKLHMLAQSTNINENAPSSRVWVEPSMHYFVPQTMILNHPVQPKRQDDQAVASQHAQVRMSL